VFLRPDEQVFRQELALVSWYLRFATGELGLALSPHSHFRRDLEAAAGQRAWWEVLQEPGLRLGRPDPDLDPKGYRTLFLFQLAEREVPFFSARVDKTGTCGIIYALMRI